MKLHSEVLSMIGNTPLVKLNRMTGPDDAEIWAKLEGFNPGGSVKDRIALAMVEKAEQEGKLKPGGTIIEPTSGNTGIGLAFVAAARGYRLILVMPESMSIERRKMLAFLGAEIVLTTLLANFASLAGSWKTFFGEQLNLPSLALTSTTLKPFGVAFTRAKQSVPRLLPGSVAACNPPPVQSWIFFAAS